MNRKFKGLGIAGVFICIGFSKFINAYYGVNGQIAVMIGCLLLVSGVILYCILKKQYIGAFCITCFTVPLFVGLIGMYMENLYLVFGGIALFIIGGAAVIKGVTRYIENKARDNFSGK